MEKLISNIISYLEYLNKNCGLFVSVHFEETILGKLPQKALMGLLEYNVHKSHLGTSDCRIIKNVLNRSLKV